MWAARILAEHNPSFLNSSMAGTRDVQAECRYINPNPPYGAGLASTNEISPEAYKKARQLLTEKKVVTFQDARTSLPGGLGAWKFDTHGLVAFKPPPPMGDSFVDEEKAAQEYWPELAKMVKELAGCEKVFVQSQALREPNPKNIFMNPAKFAHSDATKESPAAWRRFLVRKQGYTEDQAENTDICMCNVWHPRDIPAWLDPLCLLDTSTVDLEKDTADIPYVNAEGEPQTTMFYNGKTSKISPLVGPSYSPKHRWIYIPDQTPDEAWLFKQYDTREGVAKQCYHNSFVDPKWLGDEKPGRRSVEFRMLLTWPKTASAAGIPLQGTKAKSLDKSNL